MSHTTYTLNKTFTCFQPFVLLPEFMTYKRACLRKLMLFIYLFVYIYIHYDDLYTLNIIYSFHIFYALKKNTFKQNYIHTHIYIRIFENVILVIKRHIYGMTPLFIFIYAPHLFMNYVLILHIIFSLFFSLYYKKENKRHIYEICLKARKDIY